MASESLFTTTALASWKQIVAQIDKGLAALSDDDFQKEVAPGKNRIYYLIGHLAVVHDLMLPLLRIGERLHPELDEEFLTKPDRSVPDGLTVAELRKTWNEVNEKLGSAMAKLQPEEWLERHNSVSPEDFAKEPLRNRLAVLLSRTNHNSFHAGQLRLVSK